MQILKSILYASDLYIPKWSNRIGLYDENQVSGEIFKSKCLE